MRNEIPCKSQDYFFYLGQKTCLNICLNNTKPTLDQFFKLHCLLSSLAVGTFSDGFKIKVYFFLGDIGANKQHATLKS